MSDLIEYLEFVRPWSDNSLKVVTTTFPTLDEKGMPKEGMMARGVETLAHAAEMIKYYNSRGKSTWFSTQTFQRNPAALPVGRGNWFKQVHRSQQYVTELYNFYADLDVKPTAYDNLQAAVDALTDFCTKINLPPPSMLICSGNGLQPYWRVEDPLTVQQWMPIATALKNAMTQHGILADDAVTSDAARILRPAGVHNWKDPANPKPTYILPSSKQIYPVQWLVDALTPYMGPHLATVAGKLVGPVASGATGLNKNLIAGVDQSMPVDLHEVATECAVFAEQFATNGAATSQPLWSLVAMASVFDKTPWDTFDELSRGYPNYDANAARQKLAEKMTKRQQGGGWPGCDKFASESTLCQTCPHFAAGKTPLHLKAAPKAAPGVLAGTPPSLPNAYWQEHDGSIWTKFKHPKTEQLVDICVLHYAVSDGALDTDTGDILFTAVLGNKAQEVRVRATHYRNHDIRGELFRQGVVTLEADHKKVGDFVVAWVTHLQNTKAPKFRSVALGWDDAGGFTHAGVTWRKGVASTARFRDASAIAAFNVKGDPAPWQAAMAFTHSQNSPALETIVATAFAAPLMELAGAGSVMLSPYSPMSSAGKTTSMKIGAAVWGDPISGMFGLNDTALSIDKRIGDLRHMPFYWDEIRTKQTLEEIVKQAFRLGQGKSRTRLRADASMSEGASFKTMLVAASNHSLAELIIAATQETDAGAQRVFEIRMPSLADRPFSQAIVDMINKLEKNYGHVGAAYACWLSVNREAAGKMFSDFAEKLSVKVGAQSGERFWVTAMAALVCGANCANAAKLAHFNVKAMLDYLVQEMKFLREYRGAQVRSVNTASNMEELMDAIITSEGVLHTDTLSGHGGTGVINIVGSDLQTMLRNPPWAQLGRNIDMLRVRRSSFEQWLMKRGLSPRVVISELVGKYGAIQVRANIGSRVTSMPQSSTRPWCYDIPLSAIRAHLP